MVPWAFLMRGINAKDLLPGNKSGSGADAAVAKVATISKHAFGAPPRLGPSSPGTSNPSPADRYIRSHTFNNPHAYHLFPTTMMSGSPTNHTFDDHRSGMLEGGTPLAGNSDTGQSLPLLSHLPRSAMIN